MKILSVTLIAGTVISMMAVSAYAREPAKNAPTGIVQKITVPPKPVFQPLDIDPEVVRKGMQARSEYDRLTRQIIGRQTKLYEENPQIKELQKQMRELQGQIDKILESDKELARLKKEYKSMSPQMPASFKKLPTPRPKQQ